MQLRKILSAHNGQDTEAYHLQGEAGEDCRPENPSVDVTNIQSFHVLRRQLNDSISHFKVLLASQDCDLLVEQ